MSFSASSRNLLTISFLWLLSLNIYAAVGSDSVILYTPYTKIAVSPGQSIDYSIDLINKSSKVINTEIALKGLPGSWTYSLKAGGFNIRELSVLPNDRKTIALRVDVPLKVNKGSYHCQITAGNLAVLPLTLTLSEQGNYKTEFTAEQSHMQGNNTATFRYQAVLRNSTSDMHLFALMCDPPRGWNIMFRYLNKQVASVEVNANSNANISIEVDPPDMVEAGTYKIPVHAVTESISAALELELVITGSFGMELTTPSGLLSTSITAGDHKRIELVVKNTGSAELKDIQFSSTAPRDWEVTFDPKVIDKIAIGGTSPVFVSVKASKKSIVGDYMANLEAKTPEVASKVSFRIFVKTPMVWGWVGILIIVVAIGSIYYLFRRYGRR
jgi:uncharacterized membrane protein